MGMGATCGRGGTDAGWDVESSRVMRCWMCRSSRRRALAFSLTCKADYLFLDLFCLGRRGTYGKHAKTSYSRKLRFFMFPKQKKNHILLEQFPFLFLLIKKIKNVHLKTSRQASSVW
jgi:hypothetical protein